MQVLTSLRRPIDYFRNMLRDRRGAVAVEFAFLFPIAAAFTFGLIEFSLILFDYHRLGEATRRGARAAIIVDAIGDLQDLDSTDIRCTGSGSTPSDYNVSCTGGSTKVAASFQTVVQSMQAIKPDLVGKQVIVTYRDTGVTGGAGSSSPGLITPLVTVEITGYTYTYLIMSQVDAMFEVSNGNSSDISDGVGFEFPDFATSRVGPSINVAS